MHENSLLFGRKHQYTDVSKMHNNRTTVNPVLSGHSKRKPKLVFKIGFQDRLSLNVGQKYCRMLQESILQYFRPSLSYNFVFKTFVLSIFQWPLKTGFTVYYFSLKQVNNGKCYTAVRGSFGHISV